MLYLLMFTAGILVGYSLRIEKQEEDKKNIYKISDEENVVQATHIPVINKPFIIEDIPDDVIPKLHEEVEVAK